MSYLSHLAELKAKGVDKVIFIASNDAFVMSAWGKANGIKDESIVSLFLIFPRIRAHWREVWWADSHEESG